MGLPPQTRKVVIPNDRVAGCEVEQRILDQIAAMGYSEDDVFAIRLALDEALTNAIHHGNCDDPSKQVTIEYHLDEQAVEITVCDEGCGFNPHGLADPTHDANLERANGRGVMLMRAYMSQIRFNEQGNCVTMTRKRDFPLPRRV